MPIQRLPIATSLFPDTSSAGVAITGMMALNVQYNSYPDGRLYATQRYPINVFDYPTSPGSTAGTKGRGIYYWNFSISGVSSEYTYIVNDDKIYQNDYNNDIATISSGKDPVYFFEINDYLMITDPENNQVWYVEKSAPTVVTEMDATVDPAWPFATSFLAGGGAVLNETFYLMDTDGKIWNSDLNDPLSWDGGWFIEASRSLDSGVHLTTHHDNIAAISSKSIEFFYDAGNPVGSPLQRREDVFYNVGCFDRKRVFNTGDTFYFIGSERVGTVGAYIVDGFRITKITDNSMDLYLNNTIARSEYDFVCSGGAYADSKLFMITAVTSDSTGYIPTYTAVFNITNKAWSEYRTGVLEDDKTAFPVIGNSERGIGSRDDLFIMTTGDLCRFDMTLGIIDSKSSGGPYFESSLTVDPADDYLETQDDYISDILIDQSANISFSIVTPESDFNSYTNKFQHRFNLVGTTSFTSEDQTPIEISWTDDNYKTYSTPRNLDTANRRSLTRGGNFRRRAYKIDYEGQDRLLIEGVEVDVRASGYA